ncbi:MAG: response regulator transcription factor [Rhodobiaceae bacterium]|nr:response regulator transcription factor [Rhodobiaceae bacterium]
MVGVAHIDTSHIQTGARHLKVLIADDHHLFRHGFRLLLSTIFNAPEVTAVSDANEAWVRLEEDPGYDLIFLDLAMPGMNGVQGIRRFVDRYPGLRFVVLSAYVEPSDIIKCVNLGARGYIPKSASEEILHHATSLVLAGEVFLPLAAIGQINTGADDEMTRKLDSLPSDNPLRQLTLRQRDTLALMVEGLSNKEIARNMGVLESTVKAHMKVIMRKLNAQNRTQAALLAADLGWPRGMPARVS